MIHGELWLEIWRKLKLYKEASAPPNKKACCEDEVSLENQIDNIPIEEVDVQSQEDMDQEELSTELLHCKN